MNKIAKCLAFVMIGFAILACNLGGTPPPVTNDVPTQPVPSNTEAPIQPSPTQNAAEPQPTSDLDPCSLITAAEAEAILVEPVSAPNAVNGACAYSNAKDSLYMVSVAAAQGQQAGGILQGQAMMLGFGGIQLDAERMTKLKSLAEAPDYKGFFTELVAAAGGSSTLKARLIDGGGNDVTYWAWVNAQSRRQGSFVAARGETLVNINVIVAETQSEEAMLAASTSLADNIFKRLPPKFALAMAAPSAPTQQPQAVPTNTPMPPEKTVVGEWERRSSEMTEHFVIQSDGSYSIEAKNNSTNAVVGSISGKVTFDQSNLYYVDKNNHKTTESYRLQNNGDSMVINNQANKAWTRIK
jgi:hypothetical protein